MDITSILGVIIGAVLIVFVGISPAKLGNFWDEASIAIVLGGTVAAAIASYPFGRLKTLLKHTKILFQGKKYNIGALIDTLVEMAQLARKNGLLALEEKANEIDDPFFKQGIMLIVDANDPDKVRAILENDIECMSARHEDSAALYDKASSVAPAFGMVGTLVGLINMLRTMDPTSGGGDLGGSMSTALVTTLYGCILAHMIFGPIANNLRIRDSEEVLCKQIIVEGIMSIQSGENPKALREKLLTYIPQGKREEGGKSGGGE